jgi:hypothetical protein
MPAGNFGKLGPQFFEIVAHRNLRLKTEERACPGLKSGQRIAIMIPAQETMAAPTRCECRPRCYQHRGRTVFSLR